MKILLDNGHGFDTPGKRSPDGHFREYAYNRYLSFLIRERLLALGLDAQLVVPEREDISLKERCRRVNAVCRQLGNDQVFLISIHVNAAGKGQNWLDARGWSCFTTRGKTKADALATCLYEAAKNHLPGMRLRTDFADGDPDIEKDFYIIRHTSCPAVLTENLFMDNREDVAFLESAEGSQALVNLHVEGIRHFLSI
ncbi:N-acetylmuramoyl-L-alanine amidase [Bacteroidales bacterium WCE2004]|nr:N-acetylmuramoyl-L-alanine amidase [Bacteroidales bacterium WCE2004]